MKVLAFFSLGLLFCIRRASSINYAGSDSQEGSPEPPTINRSEGMSENLSENNKRMFDICEFDDDGTKFVGNHSIVFQLVHPLFDTREIVQGIKYQVHISRIVTGTPIDVVIRSNIYSVFSSAPSSSLSNNNCGEDSLLFRLSNSEETLNWTLTYHNKRLTSNITFWINYKLADSPIVRRMQVTYLISPDCRLYLLQGTTMLANMDLPMSQDCRIWFSLPSTDHGLVVELMRLNIPCSKGYIHFAEQNGTTQIPIKMYHKLCGKLEELPDSDRHIYFPAVRKSQPSVLVHGSPTFALSFRLVDFCYNITLTDKDGAVELIPTGELHCTFRIHMPFGNHVVLKLEVGDSLATDQNDTFPRSQNVKNKDSTCNGLLSQIHDSDFHWSHCTVAGDEERPMEISSKSNKVTLMVDYEMDRKSLNTIRLRMSYRAVPVLETVRMCEFGWVATQQFCITVFDKEKLPWTIAEAECVKGGGHLVSVRSEKDQQIVNNLLINSPGYRDNNAYWIGGSDRTHESDFRWSDGLAFSYTNWFPGWPEHQDYNKQPNDDGLSEQDCIELRRSFRLPSTSTNLTPGFMWNDRDCATPNYFICEKLPNDETLEELWVPDCNRTIRLSRQTPRASIFSPGFPRYYPDNADCETNIIAPSGYRIVLDFDELVIENEPSCSYDFLEIVENTDYSVRNATSGGRRLCGDWNAKLKLLHYVSQGSKLILRFSSDYSHHFGGFKARVSMENAMHCGDDRLSMFNDACYLVVNYPEVTWLTAQQICRGMKALLASILTPEEARFITAIIRKNFEYKTSALYWLGGKADPASDFKWIDGSSMDFQGWPQGEKTTDHFLQKTTDKREELCIGVKWSPSPSPALSSGIFWKAQRCNQVGGYVCKKKQLISTGNNFNKTINSSEGNLSTPNFPENYYDNLDFSVKIIGPERTRLKIRYTKVDIEYQQECLYDYVELRSISKPLHEDMSRLCGYYVTEMERFDFVSHTNEAEVRFHSDYSITGSGFSLTWQAIDVSACPTQTLTAREGIISSPNYPDILLAHLNCSITIQAPPGKRIWIEFMDVDLYSNNQEIDVIDAYVSFEMQLGKKEKPFKPFQMNSLLTEGNFVSVEETLWIKFHTGKKPKGRGFRALYRIFDSMSVEERTITLNSNSTGMLLHLNYPQPSPIHVDFLQRFIAPPGFVISMELHSLKLSHLDCSNGYGLIEVFDSYSDINGTLWRLCHQDIDEQIEGVLRASAIHIKSFLNSIQLRQKSGPLGTPLNGSLRVLPDEGYKKKLINYRYKDVESCKPNPCQNGGKCTNKKSRKICQCIGHFTGLFCAITQCDLEPCVFGTCELTNSSYKCHCKTGYLGPTCDQKRKPCEGNPCESRGTCIEKGSVFQCRCHAWWEGPRCEKRMLNIPYKPLSERMLHEPFWLGLMTVFVVMGVIGLVWCAKRHFPEKIEKLLAEDDNRNRIHSLRSTSVREQLAAASGPASTTAPSPGPTSGRSIFGRLGIRKPSILSLTSPHAGSGGGGSGYSPATARTFSLDDLLKPLPQRSPSPKKKRNNSTPTKKNVAEKKQILQQLISPGNKHLSKRVSLGELIQMSEQKNNGIQSAPSVITKETKFLDADPALTILNDPKLEKKVTFARLLNKVSAEMNSGSDVEIGIMQSHKLGCVFPRPSSTPPSPSVVNRSPNSTSSNQGSDSLTSSDLAIPSALSSSISDLLIGRRQTKTSMGKQKPASADSILAMFRNFSSSSAGINLPSSLKLSPSSTPTASSPHDDMVGDDESSSSSIHTPVSFSSGLSESPIMQHHGYSQSTIEVPVLDPISAHRSSGSGTNLLHPPTILLEIPSTINKCLSPIRELPTPLPSPMPSPAITPIMRRSHSPISRKASAQILATPLNELDNGDDKIIVEIPNISVSVNDEENSKGPDFVIDLQAEDGLIFEEAAAMQQSALYKKKTRPPPLGQVNANDLHSPKQALPLIIPTLTIETPSPTHKSPTLMIPGSPPPHRSFPNHQDSAFHFPTTKTSRKMFKDLEKPTSLDLPTAPPVITITCNVSEVESDVESISPAVKLSSHHGATAGGMNYLSPFSIANREQHASESNLSSSGYSSMASPGPSRCGSSNPLCPSEMEDPGSGNADSSSRQSLIPKLRPNSNMRTSEPKSRQGEQGRGRSDSETLSDDPLLESNDEGIGTDHIDEKIDEGEVKSAKELEVFMNVESSDVKTVLLDLPLVPMPSMQQVSKCISIEGSMDRLLHPLKTSISKHSLQLPSIIVDAATGEKYLSPVSSRSESPLSDRTTGIGKFSPLFYSKNLPFTDSDGLYDFPSTDKVNLVNQCQHKKVGRKREKRNLRSCRTPSPTQQYQKMTWNNHLDIPSNKDSYYKVPPPRKLSPKRRLTRTKIVSSSSSSESITSMKEVKHSSSSPDTIMRSSPVVWGDGKHPRSLDTSIEDKNDSNPSSPMLSRSLEFTKKQPKYQKTSRLRAIGNQIRFLRRLEQSLKRRERTASPTSESFDDSEEDTPMVTSPLLHHPLPMEVIRKSSSSGILQTNPDLTGKSGRGTKFKQWDSLQERNWPKEISTRHGNSD